MDVDDAAAITDGHDESSHSQHTSTSASPRNVLQANCGAAGVHIRLALVQGNLDEYEAICTELYKLKANTVVGSGFALLGRDLPLARVSVLESSPGEFAVVFSLSHAVADGRTYYDVLRMLQPGAEVRTLRVARVHASGATPNDRSAALESSTISWACADCTANDSQAANVFVFADGEQHAALQHATQRYLR